MIFLGPAGPKEPALTFTGGQRDLARLWASMNDASESTSHREQFLFEEAQLLLAEKRTSLSVVRTGVAVAALPLSIVSVLIATSKLYDLASVLTLFVPVVLVCAALLALALGMILRGLSRIRHYDARIAELRAAAPELVDLEDL